MVLLLSFSLTHESNCLLLLCQRQLVPVQNAQLLQLTQQPHLVVRLMGCGVVEEVEVVHRGEGMQADQEGI